MHPRHTDLGRPRLSILAHGTTVDTLLAEYPQPEEADVLACLAYGAKLANGPMTDLPAPS